MVSTYFEILKSKCDRLVAIDCSLGQRLRCGMLYYAGGMSGTVRLYAEDGEHLDIELPARIEKQSGIQYRYLLDVINSI